MFCFQAEYETEALESLIEFPKLKKITHFQTAFGLMETGNVEGKRLQSFFFSWSNCVAAGMTLFIHFWRAGSEVTFTLAQKTGVVKFERRPCELWRSQE